MAAADKINKILGLIDTVNTKINDINKKYGDKIAQINEQLAKLNELKGASEQ